MAGCALPRCRVSQLPGDGLAYRICLGVREGEVDGLGDLSFGVGDSNFPGVVSQVTTLS